MNTHLAWQEDAAAVRALQISDLMAWLPQDGTPLIVTGDFNDFDRQPLLPHKLSQGGPGVAWFDLNQDGWEDLVIGSGKGGQMAVFVNRAGKDFIRIHDPGLEVAVARDQTAPLGWNRGAGKSAILMGSANYETGETNSSGVLLFDPHEQLGL